MGLGDVINVQGALNLNWNSLTPSRTIDVMLIPGIPNTLQAPFFVIPHFRTTSGMPLAAGETFTVDLNNAQFQSFTAADGADFWASPIRGQNVGATLTRPGAVVQSTVQLIELGWGWVYNITARNEALENTLPAPNPYGWFASSAADTGPQWEPLATAVADIPGIRAIADCVGLLMYIRPWRAGDVTQVPNPTRTIGFATAVLINGLQILTAGHAAQTTPLGFKADGTLDLTGPVLEAQSGSFTPNYEHGAAELQFYKVDRYLKLGFQFNPHDPTDTNTLDYSVLQLKPTAPVVLPSLNTPLVLPALAAGNQVFLIHHPGGRTKKVSRRPAANPGFQRSRIITPASPTATQWGAKNWFADCDCDNGSSGAPVFTLNGVTPGPIAGLAINVQTPAGVPPDLPTGMPWQPPPAPNPNHLDPYTRGPRSDVIFKDFQNPTTPLNQRQELEIAVVVDTSGSMASLGAAGIFTKLKEAQDAVALFFSLLRTNPATHEAALVLFNSTATTPQPRATFTAGLQSTLMGSGNAGIYGPAVQAGGSTSIGDGLDKAAAQVPVPPPGSNKIRTILLMTDGMQNTPPDIATIAAQLNGIRIDSIGFGQPGDIDVGLMSQLAFEHGGTYSQADDGLALKKYYSLIYGNIFENGNNIDPILIIPAGQTAGAPVRFTVWGDESLTVVVGWERSEVELQLTLLTPAGQQITAATPGVEVSSGSGWLHFRFDLPIGGERNGIWEADVSRVGGTSLRLLTHNAPVSAVAYSPSGKAASGALNGTIFLWDVPNAKATRDYIDNPDPANLGVAALVFSPDDQFLFAAYMSQPVITWEVGSGKLLFQYRNSELGALTCIDISPEGSQIAVGGESGFDLVAVVNGELQRQVSVRLEKVTGVSFSPDGKFLAVGIEGGDGPFLLLYTTDPNELSVVMQFETSEPVTCVDFSPDQRSIIAGHVSGLVGLYNLNTGTLDVPLSAHHTRVTAVTFVPVPPENPPQYALSSALILDADPDTLMLLLWDVQAQTLVTELKGHKDSVLGVAAHPDGAQALSASTDKTLIPWNIPGGDSQFLDSLALPERFFVNTTSTGPVHMAVFLAETPWYYYTGDPFYPQVTLRLRNGARVFPAQIMVEITAPDESPGNLLVRAYEETEIPQEPPAMLGDAVDARTAALRSLQQQSATPVIGTSTTIVELFDDAQHYDGAMEPDGIFGNIVPDILLHEGGYKMRAHADYGDRLEGMHEVSWSIYVSIGIDPGNTFVTVSPPVTLPDGRTTKTVSITPRDVYGNYLGPGRAASMSFAPPPDAQIDAVEDGFDGRYGVVVVWDVGAAVMNGIYVTQPGRGRLWLGTDSAPDLSTEKLSEAE